VRQWEIVLDRQNYTAFTLLGGLHKLVGPRVTWQIGDKPTAMSTRAQALINKELSK
jgi:hypothetical protein